ncbi:MAG: hypothetical protein JKX83_02410 [Pseudomonadales bacterium]|nr:hypothetical protein [Pseudomonadales bacterium]
MNLIKSIAAISLCSLSFSSLADPTVSTNAFITAGISFTDSKVSYAGTGQDPKASDVSKMAVQFTFDPDMGLPITFTTQLLAKGRKGWSVEAEWAFLAYEASDNLTIKAGKILAPYFMISQSIDVGITYPWGVAPEEIYGTANIPFSSIAGMDITYTGDIGDYEYSMSLYTGENTFTVPAAGLTVDVELVGGVGFVFELTNDYGMLRYSIHDMNFKDNIGTVTGGGFPSTSNGKVLFTTYGAKLELDNILVMSEYANRGLAQSVFPTSKAWYITMAYRINQYLPQITYSEVKTSGSPLDQSQSSITAGLEVTTSASTRLNFDIIRISPDNGSAGVFDTFPVGLGGLPVDDTTKISASFSMVF